MFTANHFLAVSKVVNPETIITSLPLGKGEFWNPEIIMICGFQAEFKNAFSTMSACFCGRVSVPRRFWERMDFDSSFYFIKLQSRAESNMKYKCNKRRLIKVGYNIKVDSIFITNAFNNLIIDPNIVNNLNTLKIRNSSA